MSAQPDCGPAFPVHPDVNPDGYASGMTLRDWFAGMALQGMMNEPSNHRSLAIDDASYCYEIADAMLAARAGKEDA